MWAEPGAGPDDLASRLDSVLRHHWPELRGRVVGDPDGCRCVYLPRLCEPRTLADALAAFGRRYPGGDRRALASLYLQWHVAMSWPSLVIAVLMLGRVPAAAATAVLLEKSGTPAGLVVHGPGDAAGTRQGLERIVREHAAAVITGLLATTRLSPRVPWSSVLNVVGWTLERLEGIAQPGRLREAHEFFQQPRFRDGSVNPLWIRGPWDWRRQGRPSRRTCCLRFRLDGIDYCGDCPVPERRRH